MNPNKSPSLPKPLSPPLKKWGAITFSRFTDLTTTWVEAHNCIQYANEDTAYGAINHSPNALPQLSLVFNDLSECQRVSGAGRKSKLCSILEMWHRMADEFNINNEWFWDYIASTYILQKMPFFPFFSFCPSKNVSITLLALVQRIMIMLEKKYVQAVQCAKTTFSP